MDKLKSVLTGRDNQVDEERGFVGQVHFTQLCSLLYIYFNLIKQI